MKYSLQIFLSLFLFIKAYNAFAQNHLTDSLTKALLSNKEDTNKVKTLNALSIELRKSDLDSAVVVGKQALSLAGKLKWKKGIGFCNHLLGIFFYMKGELTESLNYDQAALSIWKELSNSSNPSDVNFGKLYIAKTSGNVANIYIDQANFEKALEYCFMALHTGEEMGDKKVEAINLGNIGNIYRSQKDLKKSLEYYNKALETGKTINDPVFILNQTNNIASVYREKKDYTKALEYYNQNLKMAEEFGVKQTQAGSLGSIGLIYAEQLKYNEAIDYYLKAVAISKEVADKRLLAFNLGNLGNAYIKLGKVKDAESYLKEALKMAEEAETIMYLVTIEHDLANLYYANNQPALALEHYKNHITYRDSMMNEENRKQLFRSEVNYEFEKKEMASKAEQEKKDVIAAEDKQKQQMLLYFVVIVAVIVMLFSFSLYKRYQITKKQKAVIEHQKQLVEESQKETIDSITYAKRLQDAILPPIKFISEHLPESFVLYKPKNIVAGDFYWAEHVNIKNNELFFIAAADSTGHGVPGALVSVVCSNALNRTLKEFNETETGKILDKTRELVLETFAKNASDVKDGMDISLLCIDKKNKLLYWSGANNPLWYALPEANKKGDDASELKEIKADKQPIGKTETPKPFTTHTLNYEAGTVFYLFTDGFADQFGGPQGKKFKYKAFGELLLKNSQLNMQEQVQIIDTAFTNWKGKLEQVDDVCVIGIRL